jgi:hypothetical protein
MDFITNLLAKFFEAFKTKNPIVAAIILGALAASLAFLESQGSIVFGEGALTWAKWINVALLALTGTHTSSILERKGDKK